MELHTAKQDAVRLLSPGAYCVLDLPIRWGDCDAMQHVNNTVFFRFMEEASMQMMLRAVGPPPQGLGTITAHASFDFLRPFTYPATVPSPTLCCGSAVVAWSSK